LKKAFTLFELIISIILVGIVYLFVFNNLNLSKPTSTKFKLVELKEKLLEYDFEKSINIKCSEEKGCFLFIDGKLHKQNIKLFDTTPVVYRYSTTKEIVEFPTLKLNNIDSYRIVFDYRCNRYKKCDEYIVELEDSIYIFKNLAPKAKKFNSWSDVDDWFSLRQDEVKDAF